jgi:hypothetical protein
VIALCFISAGFKIKLQILTVGQDFVINSRLRESDC